MDLNRLKLFHEVAKYGGVSLAAAKLNLHQSTISTSLSNLEGEVGHKLFTRHYRGMRLTSEGERLYKSTMKIFDELDFVVRDMASATENAQNVVKIATSWGTASSNWFVDRMAHFIEKNPNVKVKILDYDLKNIDSISADVFICPYIFDRPDFVQKHVKTFEFKLFASRAYVEKFGLPKKPEDLDNHRLISFSHELLNPFNEVDSLLHIGRTAPNFREVFVEVNTSIGLFKFVDIGVGIGVISTESGITPNLVPILENEKASTEVFIVYRKKNKDFQITKLISEHFCS